MKGPVGFAVGALLVIWGALPLVPAAWGIRFGAPYLVFFSMAVLGSAAFFVLLNWGPVRQPESPEIVVFGDMLEIGRHTIEALGIRGGQRGPDLSNAGKQAESRRPGRSAEDYLLEAIVDPWACFTPLPASGLVECQPAADAAKTYPQLMIPGLKERMSEADLKDLVVFLRSLKGRP